MPEKIGSDVIRVRPKSRIQPLEVKESITYEKQKIKKLERDIRYIIPKYKPSKKAEMLQEVRAFALGILTGGMTVYLKPETLYEVRQILKTEGFKTSANTITSILPLMSK